VPPPVSMMCIYAAVSPALQVYVDCWHQQSYLRQTPSSAYRSSALASVETWTADGDSDKGYMYSKAPDSCRHLSGLPVAAVGNPSGF
jgi:hypothetical protein